MNRGVWGGVFGGAAALGGGCRSPPGVPSFCLSLPVSHSCLTFKDQKAPLSMTSVPKVPWNWRPSQSWAARASLEEEGLAS